MSDTTPANTSRRKLRDIIEQQKKNRKSGIDASLLKRLSSSSVSKKWKFVDEKISQSGWLYRKDERHYPGEGGDAFIRVWAVIDYNTLTYYIDKPDSHEGIYGDPFSAGYITVSKGCRVLLEPDYPDIDSTTKAGLACFSIKEPDTYDSKGNLKNGVTATFSAVDEEIRNSWMVVLYKAVDGFKHKSPKRMSMNSPSTERDSNQLANDLEALNIDFGFDDEDDSNGNKNGGSLTVNNNNDIGDDDADPPLSNDHSSSSTSPSSSPKPSRRQSVKISTADLANTRKLVETDFYGFKEPPKKIGCLRKKAIGGLLGFRPMKQRWFRLEAGELRYYDRPSMTPARLKNVLSLNKGATIQPLNPDKPLQIVISLGDHSENMNQRRSKGSNLKLYAENEEEAEDWYTAVYNTIEMYKNAREQGNKQVIVKRKRNVRMLTARDGIGGFEFGEFNFDNYDDSNSNSIINKSLPESTEKRSSQVRFSTIETSSNDRNSYSSDNNSNPKTALDSFEFSKMPPRKSVGGSLKAVSIEGLRYELTSHPWEEAGSENSKPGILKALRSHFILSEMEQQGHLSILQHMRCIQLQPGDVATWQDTWGSNFYVIEWGSMDVIVRNNSESTLYDGTAFGELALVNEVLRTATLRALVPTRLWFIDRANFRSLLSKEAIRAQAMRVSILKSIDIFKELLPSTIERLAEALRVVLFDEIDHRIVRQDDVGDDMFIIREGRVAVSQDNNVITELGPGAHFGERALLKGTLRDATVSTITEFVSVYQLNRESFNLLVGSFSKCVDENFAISVMNSLELMDGLNDVQKQNIASAFSKKIFPMESTIFTQGDFGDVFYIIVEGEVSVIIDDEVVAELGQGQFFGEQALLSTQASGLRNATVTVKGREPLICLLLQRQDFTDLLGPIERFIEEQAEKRMILRRIEKDAAEELDAIEEENSNTNSNNNNTMIDDVDEFSTSDRNSIGDHPSNRQRGSSNTSTSSNIINSIGNFISRSSVTRSTTNTNNDNDDNSHTNTARRESASIFHRTKVRKSRNGSLIGPSLLCCPMVIESLNDICVVETLGKGEFSVVSMVSIKDESINTFYACKRILKEDIANHLRVECILNMKELSLDLGGGVTSLNTKRKAASSFFPQLLSTYQDHASVYFLYELIPGGDLHSVLYRADVLPRTELGGVPVSVAAFYVGSMLTALAHMHDRDIIYRNIRTENILIDVTGHIRLSDLSLSKKLKNSISTTSTLCGCSEYLAPEMLLSKPYNRAIDFWALGVFLYELLTATTPFEDITQAGTFHNILNSSYALKRHMESLEKDKNCAFAGDAKDLINALVHHNPTMRLGMVHGGINTVWKHPLFTSLPGFQRKYFETMMMEAPYVPLNYLENDSDIFGFQHFDENDVEDFTFMDMEYPPYTGEVSFVGF